MSNSKFKYEYNVTSYVRTTNGFNAERLTHISNWLDTQVGMGNYSLKFYSKYPTAGDYSKYPWEGEWVLSVNNKKYATLFMLTWC